MGALQLSAVGHGRASPGAVTEQPGEDRVVQDRVERGVVGAHPGQDSRVPPAGARLLAGGRVKCTRSR
jgi:hypothetical protein